jgi:hypothetical protein
MKSRVNGRDRDLETLDQDMEYQDQDETEILANYFETRPRRGLATSWDRDV